MRNFKSGFISIVGRPNVGKSTLLNGVLGEKISIISAKPQTTRNRITGILNRPDAQMIFWDTPGIHKARDLLNRVMVKTAVGALSEVDIVLFMIEADKPVGKGDDFIISLLRQIKKPVFLVINKIDLINRGALLPLIQQLSNAYPFAEVFPVSAKREDGVEPLLNSIEKILPSGPQLFDDEQLTDLPERFLVSEIIREKIYQNLQKELPYSTAVEIECFKEVTEKNLVVINAMIFVERDSQKKIIIGKNGAMIKRIGSLARKDIEGLLGAKVYLELFIKIRRGWSDCRHTLKDMGLED